MKFELWKKFVMTALPLSVVAVLPVVLISCGSTNPVQTSPENQNVYKPSGQINAKFSLEEFNLVAKGFETKHQSKSVTLEGSILQSNGVDVLWYDLLPASDGENAGKFLHKKSTDNATTWEIEEYISMTELDSTFNEAFIAGVDVIHPEDFEYNPTEAIKSKFSLDVYRTLYKGFHNLARLNSGKATYIKLKSDVFESCYVSDGNPLLRKHHLTKETTGVNAGNFKSENSRDSGVTWNTEYLTLKELTDAFEEMYNAA